MTPDVAIVTCIVLLLVFDFTNGFNDTANMVAVVVASHAMTPLQAVLVVGLFTFLGPVLAGTAVADTLGNFISLGELAKPVALGIILSGVAGAIVLNFTVWRLGLPSSSSHALVGGLAGAVWLTAGSDHVMWGWQTLVDQGHFTGFTMIVATLLLAPPAGLLLGWLLHKTLHLFLRRATPGINRPLRRLQWLGAAWLAFSHGANDAQKSMGIITLVLMLGGVIPSFVVPFWVILSCAVAITLGTLLGGWRIVSTVGFGIYRLRTIHAFESQVASAGVISAAAAIGGPVSTTHVVSSTLMGIGGAERAKAVRWTKAGEIVFTWFITLPAAGLLGSAFYLLIHRFLS